MSRRDPATATHGTADPSGSRSGVGREEFREPLTSSRGDHDATSSLWRKSVSRAGVFGSQARRGGAERCFVIMT